MSGNFRKLSQGGFTVIEILIVLTIVLVVAFLVANNIQGSVAKGRDIERRTDINAIQDALEAYWHTYEHYPSDLLAVLNIEIDISTDPTGNIILISPPSSSANKPASSYNATQPEQEYTYVPYQCSDLTAADETNEEEAEAPAGAPAEEAAEVGQVEASATNQACQKYVLYSWLEKTDIDNFPYEKSNFHNIN